MVIVNTKQNLAISLTFMYILFIELAMVTVVAVALFVVLFVTIRKLDNEKNTSLLGC